jgi:hypothetical protein
VTWLRLAALLGLVHAAFSAWWAVGGTWLLDTVGDWAVDLQAERPVAAGAGLAAIAAVKAAGALLPAVVGGHRPGGRSRVRTAVRSLSWPGGVVLVAYGGLNTVVAWLVLGGVVVPDDGYDRAAMIGHAALWDPLFLAWGLALLLGLRATRSGGAVPEGP